MKLTFVKSLLVALSMVLCQFAYASHGGEEVVEEAFEEAPVEAIAE